MKVECPSCHLAGNLNEMEIPAEGRNMQCPRCKTVLHVEKPAAQGSDPYLMNICPDCQYSTYTEEMFSVCPKCGVSGKDYHERRRRQKDLDQAHADLEALQRSFRNPEFVRPAPEISAVEQAEAPQAVMTAGWLCVAVACALLCYGSSGLYAYYAKDWQAILSEPLLEPLSRTGVFFRLGLIPWLITLFSICLMVVGGQFLRLKAWARKGLTRCAWAGLAVALVHEGGSFVEWVRISSSTMSLSYYGVGIMTALLMTALWSIPVFALLWALRQDWITREFPD